ncbi:hypothetical protein ACA910_011344 [Epithemia clementina (nom. ined.)]
MATAPQLYSSFDHHSLPTTTTTQTEVSATTASTEKKPCTRPSFLDEQPEEVVKHILSYCSEGSLYSLRLTNHRLKHAAEIVLGHRAWQSLPMEFRDGRNSHNKVKIQLTNCGLDRDDLIRHAMDQWHSSSSFLSPHSGTSSLLKREEVRRRLGTANSYSWNDNDQDYVELSFLSSSNSFWLHEKLEEERSIMKSEFCISVQDTCAVRRILLNLFLFGNKKQRPSSSCSQAREQLLAPASGRSLAFCRHKMFWFDQLSGQMMRSWMFCLSANSNNSGGGTADPRRQEHQWVEVVCTRAFSHL